MPEIQKKISILFLIGNYKVGGAERQLTELIQHLPPEKYAIHLLVKSCDNHYVEKIKSKLSSFQSLNKKNYHITDIFKFIYYIDHLKPDIVYSWAVTPSHFAFIAKLFCRHSFKLVNGGIRNAPKTKSFILWIEQLLFFFYKFVVANSYAGLKAYHQYGIKGRFVLYNGFDFNRIPSIPKNKARNILNFPADKFIVVMIASLTDFKDHTTFIKAADLCLRITGDIHFYIIGDGYNRENLETIVKDLEITSNLTFPGNREDVETILLASDLSVLTSTSWLGEGLSNSILESLACGVPVIATESEGSKEILVHGFNGYFIDNGDYRQLSTKILDLKNNHHLLQELGQNGKQTVQKKFNINAMIQKFSEILESL